MLLGQSQLEVQRPIGPIVAPKWQTVEKEWNKVGLKSWKVAQVVAQDGKCWPDSMEALRSYWRDETWWWWWWNPDLEGQALLYTSSSLLNWPRWLNTVTGNETRLASQFIFHPAHLTVVPHHQGLCRLHFTNSSVGSFMSHKNQNSERAVRQGLQFFILIWED